MQVSVIDIIKAGGFTLSILVFLSVYSFAIALQRMNAFKKALGGLKGFIDAAKKDLKGGDLQGLAGRAKKSGGAAGRVVLATLTGPTGLKERRAAAERALEREVADLEKGLPVLGTVGSTAPFIGLFGTVLGVMRAFRDLAGASNAGPGVVAVGISEALVATAAGLFVAIPAIIAYNYFTTRATRFHDEVRWVTDEILEGLTER